MHEKMLIPYILCEFAQQRYTKKGERDIGLPAAVETPKHAFVTIGPTITLRRPLLLALSVGLQQEMALLPQALLAEPTLLGALHVAGVAWKREPLR